MNATWDVLSGLTVLVLLTAATRSAAAHTVDRPEIVISEALGITRRGTSSEYFVSAWVGGPADNAEIKHAYNQYLALLIVETYLNMPVFKHDLYYVDRWIGWVREEPGLINKTVFGLKISLVPEWLPMTPTELEREVRYVKKRVPEMPGLMFFQGLNTTQELRDKADELFYRYYILPVLVPGEVKIREDNIGKASVFFEVRNIGGMDARSVVLHVREGDVRKGRRFGQTKVDKILAGGRAEIEMTGTRVTSLPLRIGIPASSEYTAIDD